MESRSSWLYQANNQESYTSLAAFVVTSVKANVMLYPEKKAIIIEPHAFLDRDVATIAGLIDSKALDFRIKVMEIDNDECYDIIENGGFWDPFTLKCARNKEIDQLKDECNIIVKQLDDEKKEKERYRKYWHDATEYNSNLRKQLAAICTLISSICPTR